MRNRSGNGHSVSVEKFLDDLKTVVRDGEKLLKAGAREIKDRTVSTAESTDQLVRRNPYKTLGIVLGIGLVVGLIAANALSSQMEEEYEEA